eukprot:jgi/Tetstr1/461531/TSEL_006637.t1
MHGGAGARRSWAAGEADTLSPRLGGGVAYTDRAQTAPFMAARSAHQLERTPPASSSELRLSERAWEPLQRKLEEAFAELGCCRKEFHRLVGVVWQHANEFNQLVVNAVGKLGCNNPLELGLQMWDMFLLMAESSLGRSFDSPLLRTLEGLHNHKEELQEELGRAVKEVHTTDLSLGLLRTHLTKARDELQAEKQRLQTYERSNALLSRSSTTVVESLRAEVRELRQALAAFERTPQKLSELHRVNRELQRWAGPEKAAMLAMLSDMDARVGQLAEELAGARLEVETCRPAADTARSEAEQQRSIAQTVVAQLEQKAQMVRVLEREKAAMVQRTAELVEESKASEAARRAAEATVNELNEARLTTTKDAATRVADALARATAAEERLHRVDVAMAGQIAQLEEQAQGLRAGKVQMGLRLAAAEARHRVQYGDKATVVGKLHSELEAMHSAKNRHRGLHEEAVQRLQAAGEELQEKESEWKAEREVLKYEHMKALDENRAYNELQLQERDRRIAELDGKLHQSQTQRERTELQEQKLKRGVLQADATVKDLQKAMKEMKEAEVYTQYDIKRLNAALAAKEDTLKEMAASVDMLQKRVQSLTKELGTNAAMLTQTLEEVQSGRTRVKELEAAAGAAAAMGAGARGGGPSRTPSPRRPSADARNLLPAENTPTTYFEGKAREREVQETWRNMSAAYRASLRILEGAGLAASAEQAEGVLAARVEDADMEPGCLTFAELSEKLVAASLEMGKLRQGIHTAEQHERRATEGATMLQQEHDTRFLENQNLRVALAEETERNAKLGEQVVKLWQSHATGSPAHHSAAELRKRVRTRKLRAGARTGAPSSTVELHGPDSDENEEQDGNRDRGTVGRTRSEAGGRC